MIAVAPKSPVRGQITRATKKDLSHLMFVSFHFGNLVFGCFWYNVTKILRNSLFIYHFRLACLALQSENIIQNITQPT